MGAYLNLFLLSGNLMGSRGRWSTSIVAVYALLDLILEWAQVHSLQAKAINTNHLVQVDICIRCNLNWCVNK